jgi:uridine kinase
VRESRAAVIREVAVAVNALSDQRPQRVAIDGVDGAGKTMFADELAAALEDLGRATIRASIDSFHNPRRIRYRQGRHSPTGFLDDSFNYDLLLRLLLDPLSPGGSGRYRIAAFDHRIDRYIETPMAQASARAVLVFDGIFLHRPELRCYWDYSVFLRVGFETSIARLARRDGGSPDPDVESNHRYVAGQELYLSRDNPTAHATIVIDNENLDTPFVVRAIRQGER